MITKLSRKTLAPILLLFILLTSACQAPQLHTEEAFKLHTLCQITTYGQLSETVYNEIWEAMDQIDETMSMTLNNSEIKLVNDYAGIKPVAVSEDVFYVVEKSLQYSDRSEKFDISIGPVVALWGIGSDNPQVPQDTELAEKLKLVNYKKVIANKEERTLYLQDYKMQIDVGAIAKGFAADRIKEILIKHNVKSAIINLGGNILTLGHKSENKPWQIGVQHPVQSRGAYFGVIPLADKTIVTSGTYERFFEENGRKYHHILDPKTGYPVENGLLSVSIIAQTSIDADALSTLIFSEGLERGLAFIEASEGIEAIFVTQENQVYITSGLKDSFQLTDATFTLMP